jgi:hypothetical protein
MDSMHDLSKLQGELSKSYHPNGDMSNPMRQSNFSHPSNSMMGFSQAQTLDRFLSLPANERERILRLFGA